VNIAGRALALPISALGRAGRAGHCPQQGWLLPAKPAFSGTGPRQRDAAELVAVSARLNALLRRLGSGWAIFVEAQRIPASDYPESRFPDAVSALVDAERRAQFHEAGVHFESAYYLTLLWMPPQQDAARAEGWLFEGTARLRPEAGNISCLHDRATASCI
jgi:type IV secretory pathway VirB4 component